jgi:hypothetical protein
MPPPDVATEFHLPNKLRLSLAVTGRLGFLLILVR